MITDAELLAGLAFLRRHADPDYDAALRLAENAVTAKHAERELLVLRRSPSADLELSVRALNALVHLKLETVGAVEAFMAWPDQTVIANAKDRGVKIGKRTTRELREVFRSLGLDWRG